MNLKPKVSVIMSVFNCEDTIDEAIESILNQTYSNFELIICDDCSTDNTYNKVLYYKKKYPDKVVLIKNDQNSKLSFSLNHCLKYATGDYVARMDGDDISLPMRLEKQVAFLMEHPEFMVVGTNMQRFDTERKYGQVKVPARPHKTVLKSSVPFCHATIMMRKTAYDKLDGYTVSKRTVRGQDRDLWFRFYAEGFDGANIQEALYMVREDMNAVKRRTFKVRWNSMLTSIMGYRLLKFPLKDYPFVFLPLIKAFIPSSIMHRYHRNKQEKIIKG
ncbi:glycosyltransferase family 2 protein [Allobacillus sp. GCM10007491]|uniref:Glycosyltransferase n=1 Tax=Allobacillus saliphilus TaxID=2912308 RepID=A0A941HRM5_9BACI|nr:glycosyltransferase family 2 protein [Allobacillus saliphilus]MBR7552548.1 glycosyltransferase [Allobacillus saliphilus]